MEFKLHKDNYRGVLRTVEQVTGLTMVYDQEGVKESEQTVATRSSDKPTETVAGQGTLEIRSVPEGAEIEANGAFVGNAPRSRSLAPGEYIVRLKKKGYKDWERRVSVAAHETLPVIAEMEVE